MVFNFPKKLRKQREVPLLEFVDSSGNLCAPWHRRHSDYPLSFDDTLSEMTTYVAWNNLVRKEWEECRLKNLPHQCEFSEYSHNGAAPYSVWDTNDWIKENLNGFWSYQDNEVTGVRTYFFELSEDMALFKVFWL